ncbi:MAG: DUF6134 family protein [Bacteroidota bacterium]
MIKKILLICAFFLSLSLTAQSQLIVYDVVKGSKKIGNVTLEISNENEQVKYHITSLVKFKILFSFAIKYQMEEKFYDGKLTWGKAHNTLNGRMQKESEIYLNDHGNYIVKIDDVASTTNEKEITYSISKLYTDEPVGKTAVFSQSFGRYLPLTKTGDHTYELESPDGTNYYTYENGICKEVKVSRDFATFYFRIQPDSMTRVLETK